MPNIRILWLLIFVTVNNTLLRSKVAVDKAEPSRRIALTLILEHLAIRSLKQKCGKALDWLALCGIGILRRVHHLNLALGRTHCNSILLRELSELGLD